MTRLHIATALFAVGCLKEAKPTEASVSAAVKDTDSVDIGEADLGADGNRPPEMCTDNTN